MVSFGAAPGLVIYEWALKGMGKLGWVAAFVYCACAALRLARFNTNLAVVDKRYFQGLPSPAAAGADRGLRVDHGGVRHRARGHRQWGAWALAMFAGLTMVSNVKFYSGKDINLRKSVPFSAVVLIVLGGGGAVPDRGQPARAAVRAVRDLRGVRLSSLWVVEPRAAQTAAALRPAGIDARSGADI